MLFKERNLKDHAEPVHANALRIDQVYFSLQFLDVDLLVPFLEPLIYLGNNLRAGDKNLMYFQSFESHRAGITLDEASSHHFQITDSANMNHIFEYENALDLLMNTSLRRRKDLGYP
jgi:hypothetical protein